LRSAENKFYLYLVHLSQIINGVSSDLGTSSLEKYLEVFDHILVNEQESPQEKAPQEVLKAYQRIESRIGVVEQYQDKFASVLKSV
jgi:hypothetical protein